MASCSSTFAPSGTVDIPATIPASLLWKFRIGSLAQHAAMWLGIAVAYGTLAHRRSLDQTSVARQQYQAATLR